MNNTKRPRVIIRKPDQHKTPIIFKSRVCHTDHYRVCSFCDKCEILFTPKKKEKLDPHGFFYKTRFTDGIGLCFWCKNISTWNIRMCLWCEVPEKISFINATQEKGNKSIIYQYGPTEEYTLVHYPHDFFTDKNKWKLRSIKGFVKAMTFEDKAKDLMVEKKMLVGIWKWFKINLIPKDIFYYVLLMRKNIILYRNGLL